MTKLHTPPSPTKGGAFLTWIQNELFFGHVAAPPPPVLKAPVFRFKGGKISSDLWRTGLAFMKWTYDTYHAEAQLRLFYNETTKEWKMQVFPQQIYSGLYTKELANHPDIDKLFKEVGDGFLQFGTLHHHCNASAFQSGTDLNDEKDQNGIHITVGSLDSDSADFHYRVVYRGFQYPRTPGKGNKISLADWFENISIDQLSLKNLPSFPEAWKTRMISAKTANAAGYGAHTSSGAGTAKTTTGSGTTYRSHTAIGTSTVVEDPTDWLDDLDGLSYFLSSIEKNVSLSTTACYIQALYMVAGFLQELKEQLGLRPTMDRVLDDIKAVSTSISRTSSAAYQPINEPPSKLAQALFDVQDRYGVGPEEMPMVLCEKCAAANDRKEFCSDCMGTSLELPVPIPESKEKQLSFP